ncbi:MAG: hypothetical protein OEY09_07710 [Gammaproteobacteria bacterium]|nr:hypothetical protein [Gammaproteobacteria bacterium]
MSELTGTYALKYNELSLRERVLIGVVVLVGIGFSWWNFYAEPTMQKIQLQTDENQRLSKEVAVTLAAISDIRKRIAEGVNTEKEQRLAQLERELELVEDRLRLKTIELIDPEDMFQLMSRLIYRESNLKLLSLKRRDVKPAITVSEEQEDDIGIYRHELEVKFSGKFADILHYMQSMEALDWKLIWDEIKIVSSDYPVITVKLVISTLSTRKEWVGV